MSGQHHRYSPARRGRAQSARPRAADEEEDMPKTQRVLRGWAKLLSLPTVDLLMALERRDVEAITDALANGADVNAVHPDYYHDTALHLACRLDNLDALSILLGMDEKPLLLLNDQRETPQHVAAQYASSNLALPLLIIAYDLVSDVDSDGNTVLHSLLLNTLMSPAVLREVLQWVMRSEPNAPDFLNIRNRVGYTVLDVAVQHPRPDAEIQYMLVEHGARMGRDLDDNQREQLLNGERLARTRVTQEEERAYRYTIHTYYRRKEEISLREYQMEKKLRVAEKERRRRSDILAEEASEHDALWWGYVQSTDDALRMQAVIIEDRAATRIQCCYRNRAAMARLGKLKVQNKEMSAAAVRIQRLVRGIQARTFFGAVKLMLQAGRTLQRVGRGAVARKTLKAVMALYMTKQRRAVIAIQSAYRGRMARRKAKLEKAKKLEEQMRAIEEWSREALRELTKAVNLIVRVWKGSQMKQWFRLVKRRIVMIQKMWRGREGRRQAAVLRAKRYAICRIKVALERFRAMGLMRKRYTEIVLVRIRQRVRLTSFMLTRVMKKETIAAAWLRLLLRRGKLIHDGHSLQYDCAAGDPRSLVWLVKEEEEDVRHFTRTPKSLPWWTPIGKKRSKKPSKFDSFLMHYGLFKRWLAFFALMLAVGGIIFGAIEVRANSPILRQYDVAALTVMWLRTLSPPYAAATLFDSAMLIMATIAAAMEYNEVVGVYTLIALRIPVRLASYIGVPAFGRSIMTTAMVGVLGLGFLWAAAMGMTTFAAAKLCTIGYNTTTTLDPILFCEEATESFWAVGVMLLRHDAALLTIPSSRVTTNVSAGLTTVACVARLLCLWMSCAVAFFGSYAALWYGTVLPCGSREVRDNDGIIASVASALSYPFTYSSEKNFRFPVIGGVKTTQVLPVGSPPGSPKTPRRRGRPTDNLSSAADRKTDTVKLVNVADISQRACDLALHTTVTEGVAAGLLHTKQFLKQFRPNNFEDVQDKDMMHLFLEHKLSKRKSVVQQVIQYVATSHPAYATASFYVVLLDFTLSFYFRFAGKMDEFAVLQIVFSVLYVLELIGSAVSFVLDYGSMPMTRNQGNSIAFTTKELYAFARHHVVYVLLTLFGIVVGFVRGKLLGLAHLKGLKLLMGWSTSVYHFSVLNPLSFRRTKSGRPYRFFFDQQVFFVKYYAMLLLATGLGILCGGVFVYQYRGVEVKDIEFGDSLSRFLRLTLLGVDNFYNLYDDSEKRSGQLLLIIYSYLFVNLWLPYALIALLFPLLPIPNPTVMYYIHAVRHMWSKLRSRVGHMMLTSASYRHRNHAHVQFSARFKYAAVQWYRAAKANCLSFRRVAEVKGAEVRDWATVVKVPRRAQSPMPASGAEDASVVDVDTSIPVYEYDATREGSALTKLKIRVLAHPLFHAIYTLIVLGSSGVLVGSSLYEDSSTLDPGEVGGDWNAATPIAALHWVSVALGLLLTPWDASAVPSLIGNASLAAFLIASVSESGDPLHHNLTKYLSLARLLGLHCLLGLKSVSTMCFRVMPFAIVPMGLYVCLCLVAHTLYETFTTGVPLEDSGKLQLHNEQGQLTKYLWLGVFHTIVLPGMTVALLLGLMRSANLHCVDPLSLSTAFPLIGMAPLSVDHEERRMTHRFLRMSVETESRFAKAWGGLAMRVRFFKLVTALNVVFVMVFFGDAVIGVADETTAGATPLHATHRLKMGLLVGIDLGFVFLTLVGMLVNRGVEPNPRRRMVGMFNSASQQLQVGLSIAFMACIFILALVVDILLLVYFHLDDPPVPLYLLQVMAAVSHTSRFVHLWSLSSTNFSIPMGGTTFFVSVAGSCVMLFGFCGMGSATFTFSRSVYHAAANVTVGFKQSVSTSTFAALVFSASGMLNSSSFVRLQPTNGTVLLSMLNPVDDPGSIVATPALQLADGITVSGLNNVALVLYILFGKILLAGIVTTALYTSVAAASAALRYEEKFWRSGSDPVKDNDDQSPGEEKWGQHVSRYLFFKDVRLEEISSLWNNFFSDYYGAMDRRVPLYLFLRFLEYAELLHPTRQKATLALLLDFIEYRRIRRSYLVVFRDTRDKIHTFNARGPALPVEHIESNFELPRYVTSTDTSVTLVEFLAAFEVIQNGFPCSTATQAHNYSRFFAAHRERRAATTIQSWFRMIHTVWHFKGSKFTKVGVDYFRAIFRRTKLENHITFFSRSSLNAACRRSPRLYCLTVPQLSFLLGLRRNRHAIVSGVALRSLMYTGPQRPTSQAHVEELQQGQTNDSFLPARYTLADSSSGSSNADDSYADGTQSSSGREEGIGPINVDIEDAAGEESGVESTMKQNSAQLVSVGSAMENSPLGPDDGSEDDADRRYQESRGNMSITSGVVEPLTDVPSLGHNPSILSNTGAVFGSRNESAHTSFFSPVHIPAPPPQSKEAPTLVSRSGSAASQTGVLAKPPLPVPPPYKAPSVPPLNIGTSLVACDPLEEGLPLEEVDVTTDTSDESLPTSYNSPVRLLPEPQQSSSSSSGGDDSSSDDDDDDDDEGVSSRSE